METKGGNWPTISIVTPSFNQAQYLEATIRSVLLQGYPALEYFVIDGGSTDGSQEIIRRYERWLTGWVSEKDGGQTDAINKGMRRCSGSILAYINSDDYFLPGAFRVAAEQLGRCQVPAIFAGRCAYVDETGAPMGSQLSSVQSLANMLDIWRVWFGGGHFVQAEVFWNRALHDVAGGFRQELHYVMDFDFWLRALAKGATVQRLDMPVACFRKQPMQKTGHSDALMAELLTVIEPWLWDPTVPLAWADRMRLQGQWLHHAIIAPRFGQRDVGLPRRLLRLMGDVLRHPRVLRAPDFWRSVIGR